MSEGRLDILIYLWASAGHRASVLREGTAEALIEGILHEFGGENLYLTPWARVYRLWCLRREMALEMDVALGQQGVCEGDQLVLRESGAPLPAGKRRPVGSLYLRELGCGVTHGVWFVPCCIGRQAYRPDDVDLAVDLTDRAESQKVSRRQAGLNEIDGRFYLRRTADNPVWLNGVPLVDEVRVLEDQDEILLVRSGIRLRVLLRAT